MPDVDNSTRNYKQIIKDILVSEGLTMNEDNDKTKEISLLDKKTPAKHILEYLGYKFIFGFENREIDNCGRKSIKVVKSDLILTISSKKKTRYGKRLLKAFTIYQKQSKGNEKHARKCFVKRIKFLMSNTRLVNNKQNVITGIYYTNSLVNSVADFQVLDRYFSILIKHFALPTALANRISPKNSFVKGFNPTCISKFNAVELNTIMKSWTK
jgi:hypothetical protein